jgi:thiamine biosynthesis lipoprotein
LFEEYEQQLSRFLPWSEFSALNRCAGSPFQASPVLFSAVEQALAWAQATNGVFDPTVIDVLEASGYDKPFDLIVGGTAVATRSTAVSAPYTDIRLDHANRTISLPEGARIDLGGIGKGFTVDRAIDALGEGANAMVNASGDLFAAGGGPEGDGWVIGVQDPAAAGRDLAVLRVRDRGVATSGSNRRHWSVGDDRYHHLIDARARRCSASDLVAVTVVAETATQADVLAKTAFLLGSREGLTIIEHFGGAALAVTHDGSVVRTNSIQEYML